MDSAVKNILNSHKNMQSLCLPLFFKSPFVIVNYIRLFKSSNQVSYLCDNYAWLENYLKSQLFLQGAFETNAAFHSLPMATWDLLDTKDEVKALSREKFNIFSGITLIKPQEHCIDFFNFGSNSKYQHDLIRFYPFLENFVQEFYDKGNKLIVDSSKNTLHLDSSKESNTHHNPDDKKLYLGPNYNYHYLTHKEQLIIHHLTKGLNTQDIANIEQKSKRTLEKQIARIKEKLNCQSLFELGYVVKEILQDVSSA